jgi:hypothetical protein
MLGSKEAQPVIILFFNPKPVTCNLQLATRKPEDKTST